ncbi:PapB/FocB family fimbrial expression transcriptional regulator [Escherichia coli]|uniref:PapB/FocB family fimbrial expression transcriptional regulator n=1 Tax=Escherichia coli TaxID=562 RepID=UPI001918C1F7|nr:major pilu subunit operon regulatory protein PapB [Escherichia coli]
MSERKCYKSISCLNSGEVSKEHFNLLIKLSNIRGSKTIQALYDFFVEGKTRREIYVDHSIDPGNLSRKISDLQKISRNVIELYPHYLARNSLRV